MEKTSKRVSKHFIKATTLAILLAVLTSGSAGDGKFVDNEVKYSTADLQEMIKELPQSTLVIPKVEPKKPKVVEVKEKVVKKEIKPEVKWLDFKMTHYVATCKGCSGRTSSGYSVKSTIYYQDYRVLSVDPRQIKEGSIVEIDTGEKKFKAIALDTGGAIKGRKLDLLVKTKKEALQDGKKNIKLRVVRDGWGENGKPKL